MNPKEKITFATEPGTRTFQALCGDMYKMFGGCYNNLKILCHTPEERTLLMAQLHTLRGEVRELLEKARKA